MKIALLGYARSGKDTVAGIISKNAKNPTVQLAFGTRLKSLFHETFPDVPMVPKPRNGYERFGKAMRDIDKEVWINHVAKMLEKCEAYEVDFNCIITDVRQLNEVEWCKANGFHLIYVNSWDRLRRERSEGDSEFNEVNESERELWVINSDYVIFNNGTLADLEAQVVEILDEIGGQQ
jgi:dephospho-CoA kinase